MRGVSVDFLSTSTPLTVEFSTLTFFLHRVVCAVSSDTHPEAFEKCSSDLLWRPRSMSKATLGRAPRHVSTQRLQRLWGSRSPVELTDEEVKAPRCFLHFRSVRMRVLRSANSRADRLALAESKETTELVTDKSFNLPPP